MRNPRHIREERTSLRGLRRLVDGSVGDCSGEGRSSTPEATGRRGSADASGVVLDVRLEMSEDLFAPPCEEENDQHGEDGRMFTTRTKASECLKPKGTLFDTATS